jgi:hypothetical protein
MERPRPKRKQDLENRVLNWANDAIKDVFYYDWFHTAAAPIVNTRVHRESGVSDAIILKADVQIELFVKFHPQASRDEEGGYQLLQRNEEFARHLIPSLSQTSTNSQIFWLAPLINAKTLHQLIHEQVNNKAFDRWVKRVYNNFLDRTKKLWEDTRVPDPPDLREIYLNRIWKRETTLQDGLGIDDLSNVNLVVNGKDYGSYKELMSNLSERIDKIELSSSCTTHSDEHANNIMIYNDAERNRSEDGWIIIDYAGVQKNSDWILSIAKMFQWWEYYCVLERAKNDNALQSSLNASRKLHRLRSTGKRELHLSYNEEVLKAQVSPRCKELSQKVLEFARDVGRLWGEDEDSWNQRLKLALFSIIFASVPLHIGKADFAVPIMIGEGLKYLSSYGGNDT